MAGALVLRGGRVIDAATDTDRVTDVVVEDGRILAVGPQVAAPVGARVLDLGGTVISAGWIDAHTHVFGDIGIDDADTAGVLAGVTTLIDAGSSGSLTVDEFLARTARCRTDVYAIPYLDRRGIADTATIPTSPAEIPSVPVGELRRAVERHGPRILGVKTGIYADLGRAWAPLALAAAELIGVRAYVHIGNFRTHTSADTALIADLLERLRPGDVVTHCYTGQPGGLVDEHGELLPEALVASARGVVFDLGHSGAGFDLDVARRLRVRGLIPTSISSDVAIINVRQRVRSLAHVLGNASEAGFSLPELVEMVTLGPARTFGLPGGTLAPGSPADLTVFTAQQDGDRTAVEVQLTVKGGEVIAPEPEAVLREENLRFRVLPPPGAPRHLGAAPAELLGRLASCLPHLPAAGDVLQQVVAHLAGEAGLAPDVAAAVVRRSFADRDGGNQVGWLLAESIDRAGHAEVAERLAAAAVAVRSGGRGGGRREGAAEIIYIAPSTSVGVEAGF